MFAAVSRTLSHDEVLVGLITAILAIALLGAARWDTFSHANPDIVRVGQDCVSLHGTIDPPQFTLIHSRLPASDGAALVDSDPAVNPARNEAQHIEVAPTLAC